MTPRIPPRPTESWTEDVDDVFSALSAHGPASSVAAKMTPETRPRSNLLGVYAWHPKLMRGWMPYSNHLRHSTLGDRLREMVIIRTTWLGYGEYEWAQHVQICRAGGWLTEEELLALRQGCVSDVWSEEDAVILRAVEELCIIKNVSDATWSELEKALDRQQLLDLLFTVGTYDFHCTVFRAIGLQIEAGVEGFPDDHFRNPDL